MKLSEAILLSIGAVKNDPTVFLVSKWGDPCGCAIGTALFSIGMTDSLSGIDECHQTWPWTAQRFMGQHDSIAHEISMRHSNGESREALAQWVATIEPVELDPTPTPTHEHHAQEATR